MDAKSALRHALIAQRLVPVLRLASAELTERAIECLHEAGFGIVEITMTTPGAIEVLKRTQNAGAKFLVSPCLVPGLAKVAHDAGRLALIGGYTPGEILAAGAELVGIGNDMIDTAALAAGERERVVRQARRFLR